MSNRRLVGPSQPSVSERERPAQLSSRCARPVIVRRGPRSLCPPAWRSPRACTRLSPAPTMASRPDRRAANSEEPLLATPSVEELAPPSLFMLADDSVASVRPMLPRPASEPGDENVASVCRELPGLLAGVACSRTPPNAECSLGWWRRRNTGTRLFTPLRNTAIPSAKRQEK